MRTMVSKFVSVFIIICLITVGAFALSLVSAHEHAEGYSCPISTIKGASECTPGLHKDVLAFAFYHISGIHSLTHGVGGTGVDISLLITILFTAVIILRIFTLNFDLSFSPFSYQRRQKVYEYIAIYWKPFLKWISLRNKYAT